jgi:hypothetical protein
MSGRTPSSFRITPVAYDLVGSEFWKNTQLQFFFITIASLLDHPSIETFLSQEIEQITSIPKNVRYLKQFCLQL